MCMTRRATPKAFAEMKQAWLNRAGHTLFTDQPAPPRSRWATEERHLFPKQIAAMRAER